MNLRLVITAAVFGAPAMAGDVAALLEPIREKHGLPALAAAAVVDGKIAAIGATGLRRLGGTERVTVEDKWHLGSCTKSMTAALAAILVEDGKIGWQSTVGEVLGKPMSDMDPKWAPVTLELLLCHRAGAPHDAPPGLWKGAWEFSGPAAAGRTAFVRGLLRTPPDPEPGTKYVYSNQGYSIAGEMLQAAAGQTWEDLLAARLFKPLGLSSAGYGAAGDPVKVDQPWGHRGTKPVPPGKGADNPPAIAPGGIVHMSIGDFARYAAWHLEGARLLKAETFAKLHTPLAGQEYGFGWNVTTRPWANGTVWTHGGTNTMNYAVMWLAPNRKFAVVAATNMGGDAGAKGADEAAAALIGRVLE